MQRYFARDQTLTYPLCTMTVTVYHTTFNPFECRRAVLEGVHYETRRTVAVDKTGAAHSAGYLLIMIALSIVMAITVEGLVELGKSIGKAALDGDRKTAATQLAALIISCALCMAAGADVYDALGVSFAVPWLGMVLTGILASRGSNYIADFVKRLQTIATDK